LNEFKNNYLELYEKETFNPVFLDYYDNYSPINFQIENPLESGSTFEKLFNDETSGWTKELLVLENDKQLIEAIENKQFDCNSFDFEGIKYQSKNANIVKNKIHTYIEELRNTLQENDQKIFNYFYTLAKNQNKEAHYLDACKNYLKFDTLFDANLELYTKIINYLKFTTETTTFEVIKSKFYGFKSLEEVFQKELLSLAQIMLYKEEISKEKFNSIEEFSSNSKSYFSGERYDEYNLQNYMKCSIYSNISIKEIIFN